MKIVEHIARYVVTVLQGNITGQTVVMDVKVSFGEVFVKTINISADFHGIVLSTRIKGINAGTADYENVSELE